MVWKMKLRRGTKASSVSLESAPGSQGSMTSTKKRAPTKGCLRTSGSNSESSPASSEVSASSSRSSVRSETEKCCDQSSWYYSQPPESLGSSASKLESLDVHRDKRMTPSMQSLASGSTASSKSKRVQFSVVEIRDYEREVGDNPSCSDGCPITIGWTHLDSRVVHVNHYENGRSYRKAQLEMVLTRDEREALLGEWGVQASDIISATRAMHKAKNQRRQTIQNLSKAAVEEGIEAATRKLKKMLSLKRVAKKEVKTLQFRANALAETSRNTKENAEQDGSDACLDDGQERQQAEPSASQVPYPQVFHANGNILNSFDFKLGPTRNSESVVSSESFPAPASSVLEDQEMDAISCISGFTLGNSTTASAKAIERFHQELEIELFGDQELPSMVGKTLEVDVAIPEEEKIYHDPSPPCASVVSDLLLDESVVHQSAQIQEQAQRRHQAMTQDPPNVPYVPIETSFNTYDGVGYSHDRLQSQQGQHDASRYGFRLGGSFGSADIPGHAHAFAPPQGRRLAERIPYSTANSTISWSTISTSSTCEGPEVSHVSLLSHLSPNNWMEGTPFRQGGRVRSNHWESVIISEEEDDNILDGLFFEQLAEQYKVKTII